jgi:hypothetical protein
VGQIAKPEAQTDALTVALDGDATQHQGLLHLTEHCRPPAIERNETLQTCRTAGRIGPKKGCGFSGLPHFP